MIITDWFYIIGFVAFWVVLYKLTHRKKLRLMRVRNRQLREAEKTKLTLMEEEIELLRLQIMELRSQLYD